MNKLKTLKDFEADYKKNFEEKSSHQPGGGIDNIELRKWFRDGYKVSFEYAFKGLRQEAIKWIKAFRDKTNVLIGLCCGSSQEEIDGAIGFTKAFFNITEEDIIKCAE